MLRNPACFLVLFAMLVFDVSHAAETPSFDALLLEAKASASQLKRESDRQRFLLEIAEVEAVFGNRLNARMALDGLRQKAFEADDILALQNIAFTEAKIGDIENAKETLGLLSQEMADNNSIRIAEKLSKRSNFQASIEITSNISRDIYKSMALTPIGVNQAETGHLADAMKTREAIVGLSSKSWTAEVEVLTAIAAQQANIDEDRARKTLLTALELSMALPKATFGTNPRWRAFRLIAVAWAKMGSEQDALSMIARIGDKRFAERTILMAANAAAKAGKSSVSRSLLKIVIGKSGTESRVSAGPMLVSTYLSLGDIESALRIASLPSKDCDVQARSVAKIAQAQANAGVYKSALSTIARVGTYSEPSLVSTKSLAFSEIADAQAKGGEFAAARETADSIMELAFEISDAQNYECGLHRGIVTKEYEKTDWRRVTNLSIVKHVRSSAYRKIARAMAAAGLSSKIENWAKEQTSVLSKASIFLGGAEGLASSARPPN